MKKVEIKLDYPVEVNGESFEVLHMRRPKVRDMLAGSKAQGDEAEKEVRIFATLCEVPPVVIEELDYADYQKLVETFNGFLSSQKQTAAA